MSRECLYCGRENVEVVQNFRKIKGRRIRRPQPKNIQRTIFWCPDCERHSVKLKDNRQGNDNAVQKTIQDSK